MENIQYYPHLCACGCGDQIEVKKYHKYLGIPNYIKGHNRRNKQCTEETRQKLSASHKGKIATEETRQRMSVAKSGENNPWYGKNLTEEHRQRISEAHIGLQAGEKHPMYGKPRSEETKQKIKLANTGKFLGEKHPMYGKKHTDEARQKIKKARSKQIITEEHKLNLSIKFSGRIFTEEWRNKLSEAAKERFKNKENCPNWNNGSSFEPYGIEFNKEKKQQVLERDNYTCQCPDCERKTDKLDIHHIDYDKENNNSENLITLCDSCHAKTNGKNNRQFWITYYKNIIGDKK